MADKIGQLVAKTLVENKFDGVVLEFWTQLGGQAKLEAAELVRSETTGPASISPLTPSAICPL